MAPGHATRRQLLTRAFLAGGTALGAAAGSPSSAGGGMMPAPESDAELVSEMLAVESLAEFVVQTVLATGLLPAHSARVVRIVLEHEQAHARLLVGELDRLGAAQPAPPATTTAADQSLAHHHVSRQVAGLRHEQDAIKLLIELESLAQRTYYDRMSKLSGAPLLRTAAEIMCSEAQHYTALAQLVRPHDIFNTVPDAFVEGNHSVR